MRVQTRRAFGESRIHACRCVTRWGAEKESRGAPDWLQVIINTSASDTLSHATRRSGRALPSSKTRAGPERWLTSLIRTTFDLATAGQGGTVRSLTGVGQTKCISKSDWRHLTTHNHNNCAFVGAIKSSPVCATGRKRMPCALASSEKRRFLRAVTLHTHLTHPQQRCHKPHPTTTSTLKTSPATTITSHSTDGRTVVTLGVEYHPSAITSCFWIECTCRQREKEREEGACSGRHGNPHGPSHKHLRTSCHSYDVRSLITFLMPLTGTCHWSRDHPYVFTCPGSSGSNPLNKCN
jgi:hypothetical protein